MVDSLNERAGRTWRGAIVGSCALVAFAVGVAGARQQPARDAGGPPKIAGTAAIVGTLVTDDGPARPIRRATVTLNGTDGSLERMSVTDDGGRFVFTRLAGGSFSLTAAKPGYVRTFYGSKRQGRGPGTSIALADGQRISVSMKMLQGGVITGTIVDPNGRPAPQLPVLATAYQGAGTDRSMMLTGSGTTDDRGIYRIFGLAPGSYAVSVAARSGVGNIDLRAVSREEVQWAQRQLSSPASRGGAAGLGGDATMPPVGKSIALAPVYYPGTTDASLAATVVVAAGQEHQISFALQHVAAARIEGQLLDPSGQPAPSGQITLLPKSAGTSSNAASTEATMVMIEIGLLPMTRVPVTNGRFTMSGIAPGAYTLTARGIPAAPPGAEPPRLPMGRGSTTMTLWGEADVTVDGRDQLDLAIALQPGMSVSGSLAFDGALPPPADLTRVRLTLSAQTAVFLGAGTLASTVRPDGTFTFSSLPPGRYVLRATNPVWALKSAIVNGRDAADAPVDIRPGGDITGAVVTFIDRETEVSGTLLDAAGRPAPDFSVIAFATDRAFWMSTSRRIRATRPASNGTFRIAGLPAGEYYICAISDYEPQDLYAPAFLEQLLGASYKITLADREKKTQDLKIAGGR